MDERDYLLMKIDQYEQTIDSCTDRKTRKKTFALLKRTLVKYLEITQTEMKKQKDEKQFPAYFETLIENYEKLMPLCRLSEKVLVKAHIAFLKQSRKRVLENL